MAEWPELEILRGQMGEALIGKRVASVDMLQEKCLNVPVATFLSIVTGKVVAAVARRGKWLLLQLDPGYWLAICPGMGFDLWHFGADSELPPKYQLKVAMDDGSGFTCRFWWFGYVRLLTDAELPGHPELAKLGPDPVAISADEFRSIALRFPRKVVKSLILEQDKLSGIGNAYAHDILWTARLHPSRKLGDLTEQELVGYHGAIRYIMDRARRLGGLEDDYYRTGGNHAHWEEFSLIGYKEGKPCPNCGAPIEKIKTGATASFICPTCQPTPTV